MLICRFKYLCNILICRGKYILNVVICYYVDLKNDVICLYVKPNSITAIFTGAPCRYYIGT